MKIFIGIIIALGSIVALLLIIGLFVKKDYTVGKEVIVNKSKSFVFDYLRFLKNQNKFSVWATMDPNMKTEYSGTDGTEGFVSAWDSENKNVGKGEQEILKIVNGERIDYEIRFIKPFASTSWANMIVASANENQTRVHWEFTGKMKYPTNLTLLFMNMEKMVGNDLEKGLQNLKTIMDK
jgi:Polyketide cyclase / dehydrase and lipid transport